MRATLTFYFIILFSFIVEPSFSQDQFISEGEFWAAEDDTNEFVKRQLKTSALKSSLNQFFDKMELNSTVFWQLLDRKVAESLEKKESYFTKKIEKARNLQEFDKVLELESKWRKLRLSHFSRLLEKKRLYLSFASGPVTSSMVNPQLKIAKYKVKLNRQMVKSFYFEITKSNSNRRYQNLLITLKININEQNVAMRELNENINVIKSAVENKWINWFEREYRAIFNNFIITNESQERILNQYILSPPGTINKVDSSLVEKSEVDSNLSESVDESSREEPSSDPTFQSNKPKIVSKNEMGLLGDSQWLLINISMDEFELDNVFERVSMKVSGGQLFFDLNSREIIHEQDFIESKTVYQYSQLEQFVSELGTYFYNLPMEGLRRGLKIFTKAPQINNQAKINIKNIENPEQIIGLSDFLNLGGSGVNLKVSSFDLVDSGANITVNYFGDIESLKAKFSEWENKQVIPNKRWRFSSLNDDLTVILENEDLLDAQVVPFDKKL